MAEISIHCIPQSGTDAAEVATDLEVYLRDIDGIDTKLVEVEQTRIGSAEVLAIIQLTSATIDLTVRLTDFIKSRRDKGKTKDIEVEIDGQRVPVGDLTPDQKTRLADAIARGASSTER